MYGGGAGAAVSVLDSLAAALPALAVLLEGVVAATREAAPFKGLGDSAAVKGEEGRERGEEKWRGFVRGVMVVVDVVPSVGRCCLRRWWWWWRWWW